MYLPPQARFANLLALPEGENIGKAINEAMKAVEAENEELKGVLPKGFTKIENATLIALLKNFSAIPVDAEGDTFGKIYEYFLGNFARSEGQKGGEFNVDKVDKEKIKDDPRFPFGMPKADNANYLWIELFYSALNAKGRAGFVMANSAADARQSEMEIRKKLLLAPAVDVMVAIGPNFFYTVTLPCTLWFFDKRKSEPEALATDKRKTVANASGSENLSWRKDKVLFLDARHIFRQVDRVHRKFSPKQIEYLANIVRLYRGEKPEFTASDDLEHPGLEPDLKATFPNLRYDDVAGLCKVATLKEIEAQG
jgi:type I restriction-modification system DNA methylase subunit